MDFAAWSRCLLVTESIAVVIKIVYVTFEQLASWLATLMQAGLYIT